MPDFRREHHQLIARLLRRLDGKLLAKAGCYFGGGTRVALALNEFRESRDIDFLCSDRAGFRMLRESISTHSLGPVLRKPVALAREVRADRDGIRTYFSVGAVRIKFEIILEARIELHGEIDRTLGVPVLDLDHTVAEKLMANSDRGADDSTHARDVIDLAFLAAHLGKRGLAAGTRIAEEAYGAAIMRDLRAVLRSFTTKRARSTAHLASLGVTDTKTLRKGLTILRSLAK